MTLPVVLGMIAYAVFQVNETCNNFLPINKVWAMCVISV